MTLDCTVAQYTKSRSITSILVYYSVPHFHRPIATITWNKGSQTLSSGGRISILQYGRVLVINETTASDAGIYTCQTSQPATADTTYSTSVTGQLTVIGEPLN